MPETQGPQLEDIGYRIVRTTLPHLPDSITGQGQYHRFLDKFQGHPEQTTLARIYGCRVATKTIESPDHEEIEIGLAVKNHPYLLATPYETMVQYFGARPVATVAEWRDEQFPIGLEYFNTVATAAEAMVDLVDEPAKFVISTNSAPYSKYTKPLNVQSVAAPHTHVLAFTQREADGAMKFMDEFSSKIEARKYGGLNSATNELYRQIVYDLFRGRTRDEHDVDFDDIGADIFSPVQLDDARMSLNDTSPEHMPPGFSFIMRNGLQDMRDPDFMNRVILWDDALRRTYTELASIFIKNYDDIPNIGRSRDESVPLELRSFDDQMLQYHAFIQRHNGRGSNRMSPATAKKLGSFVRNTNSFLRTPEGREHGGDYLTKHFTRGHAYSLVAHPLDWQDPHGPWKVKIPVWLYGGGGVEAIGIEKDRLTEGDPRNPLYTEEYLQHLEERHVFNRALVDQVTSRDPFMVNCLI